jgi:16S rRNA (cytosine967-C5)-methyltransferase
VALVDDAQRIVGLRKPLDPKALLAAAKPRVLAVIESMHRAFVEHQRPGRHLRTLMRDAKQLHSRERRLVSDAAYDLIRFQGILDSILGSQADAHARFLAWQTWHGLSPDTAEAAHPTGRYAAAATFDLPKEATMADLASLSPQGATLLAQGLTEDWVDFVAASNQRAPMTLRCNGRRDQVAARLADEGVETTNGNHCETALVVSGRANVLGSQAFRNGQIELQDEASQCLAIWVAPAGRVLDYCAGAGGKALAMAANAPDAQIYAWDVRKPALDELRRRRRRGRQNITVLPSPSGTFDHVLVDAPCSGSGVWRRHPSYRRQLDQLHDTLSVQRQILDDASTHVETGGRLTYATCSVLSQENEHQVASFLKRHPDFQPLGPAKQLWPHIQGTDGIFGQTLVRK